MNSAPPSEKKWTRFPEEYRSQIQEVFEQEFGKRLKNPKFFVEGRIDAQFVVLKVGYLEEGRLRQNNFSLRFSYNTQKDDVKARIHSAVDVLAGLILDFIESEENDESLPRDWKPFEHEKKSFELMYSTENTDLEAEANRLLGESSEESQLVEIDDSDDNDPDDDSKPTLH